MPKIVDHDARRQELVAATWRIIARGGFAAATLQSVETEAGFSHGVVRHYFSSKDELLGRAFEMAYEHTLNRATTSIGDGRGLGALRKLCLELLPLDAERYVEAQVVVAFWDHAANNAKLAATHTDAIETWRRLFLRFLDEAERNGEITGGVPTDVVAEQLLLVVNGAQVGPAVSAKRDLETQVDVIDWILSCIRAVA